MNNTPSLEAANQAQIDDLVRRNHTLEYTNKKLSDQLSTESARSKQAVLEIQKQWHENQKLWREECDDLLACYRYVQLRTVSEVESERVNVMNEQKALRREKLLRLQRDYRITMFHARERELEERIQELEEENEQMVVERKEIAVLLRQRLEDLVAQLQLKDSEIEDLTVERDETEKDSSKLREENAHLQASLDSTSSRFERTNLQLEGAQTARSELEGLNDDLKRKNHDLQRQLDKWQRLENKGDAELDALRKRKIELEIEAKELRDRLDKVSEESAKALEKERKRVDRVKETTRQWQEVAERHELELEHLRKELEQLQTELEQLRAQQERTPVEPSVQGVKPSAKHKKQIVLVESEAESEPQVDKPPRRRKGVTQQSGADAAQEPSNPPPATRRRQNMSPVMEEADSEIEEVDPQPLLGTKGKKTKEKGKEKAREEPVQVSEDEVPQKPQRKRKTVGDDSTLEKAKQTNDARSKTANRAIQNTGDPENREDTEAPKKKRKKMNIFAQTQSQPGLLDFGAGSNIGLGIPTALSPVKETDGPIPSRAISGSIVSGLGGLIRSRMTGRA